VTYEERDQGEPRLPPALLGRQWPATCPAPGGSIPRDPASPWPLRRQPQGHLRAPLLVPSCVTPHRPLRRGQCRRPQRRGEGSQISRVSVLPNIGKLPEKLTVAGWAFPAAFICLE